MANLHIEMELEALRVALDTLNGEVRIFGEKHANASGAARFWYSESPPEDKSYDDRILETIRRCQTAVSEISYNIHEIDEVIQFVPLPAIPSVKARHCREELKALIKKREAILFGIRDGLALFSSIGSAEGYWFERLEEIAESRPVQDIAAEREQQKEKDE